jgi:hypothetical protein
VDGSGQIRSPSALPHGNHPPVTIGREAVWAPEQAWTLWRREKSVSPAANRVPILGRPEHSLVAKQLSYPVSQTLLVHGVNVWRLFVVCSTTSLRGKAMSVTGRGGP